MTKIQVNAVWEDNSVFADRMSPIRFRSWYNRLEKANELPKELIVNGKPFSKEKGQTMSLVLKLMVFLKQRVL